LYTQKHASFGGGGKRRMFTMNFCERFPEVQIEQFIQVLGSEARFWIDSVIGSEMRRTASPARWVHLEQAIRADAHLTELHKQKRQEMTEPSRG
jgi:hypothetical protein